jgi:exodeoxyribonuclease III
MRKMNERNRELFTRLSSNINNNSMRIISWNVNGIRATHNKWELAKFIATYDPDIIFMQEIKCGMDKMPRELMNPPPYTAYYNPAEKPGYAGTWVWVHARVSEIYDIAFYSSFPGDPTANEGRVAHIELRVKSENSPPEKGELEGVSQRENPDSVTPPSLPFSGEEWAWKIFDIFGIYFPNWGKSPEAWQGKLVFYREFKNYLDSLRNLGHAVLWGGDINCAHHAIDLARPEANDGKIGFHPLEREWLDACTSDGWSDMWRERNPTLPEVYSWWDPVTRSRERNVGWRIDAWWGEQYINAKIRNISYLPTQMWSDHCPMMVEIEI